MDENGGQLAEQLPFSLSQQPASEFPVGQEWRETVPLHIETDEMFRLAYDEWQRLTKLCMEDRGFSFIPRIYIDEMRTEFYRALNPLNEEVAELYGYHPPPQPEVREPNSDSSEQFNEALDGTETNQSLGCAPQAIAVAYREAEPIVTDYQVLVDDLDQRTSGYFVTKEGVGAIREWSDCMKVAGYSYLSPDEPLSQFIADVVVGDEELRVRKSDLNCDKTASLTEKRSRWERTRANEWAIATETQWAELGNRVSTAVTDLENVADQ